MDLYDTSPVQQGGEMMIVAIKAKSGAIAVTPVDQTADPIPWPSRPCGSVTDRCFDQRRSRVWRTDHEPPKRTDAGGSPHGAVHPGPRGDRILTMFPLGASQMAFAVRDNRSTEAAFNADSYMRTYWKTQFIEPLRQPSPRHLRPLFNALDDPDGPDDPNQSIRASPVPGPARPVTPCASTLWVTSWGIRSPIRAGSPTGLATRQPSCRAGI